MGKIAADIGIILQHARDCGGLAERIESAAHRIARLQQDLSPSRRLTGGIADGLHQMEMELLLLSEALRNGGKNLEDVAGVYQRIEKELLELIHNLPGGGLGASLRETKTGALSYSFSVDSPIKAVPSLLIQNRTLSHGEWLLQLLMKNQGSI